MGRLNDQISIGDCNTFLSACAKYKHLGWYYTHPPILYSQSAEKTERKEDAWLQVFNHLLQDCKTTCIG